MQVSDTQLAVVQAPRAALVRTSSFSGTRFAEKNRNIIFADFADEGLAPCQHVSSACDRYDEGNEKKILTFGNWQLLTLFLKGARVNGMRSSRSVIIVEVNSWFLAWIVQCHIGRFRSMLVRQGKSLQNMLDFGCVWSAIHSEGSFGFQEAESDEGSHVVYFQ